MIFKHNIHCIERTEHVLDICAIKVDMFIIIIIYYDSPPFFYVVTMLSYTKPVMDKLGAKVPIIGMPTGETTQYNLCHSLRRNSK